MKHGHWVLNWIIHMTITEAYQQMHSLLLRISVGYYQSDAVRLFWDGAAAIGFVKVKDGDTSKAGQIGFRPGIAVKLNDHFSFIAKYGFLGYRRNVNTPGDSFGLKLTSEDLSIGFHYAF